MGKGETWPSGVNSCPRCCVRPAGCLLIWTCGDSPRKCWHVALLIRLSVILRPWLSVNYLKIDTPSLNKQHWNTCATIKTDQWGKALKAPGTRAFFFFLRKREGSYTAGPQSLTSMSRTPKTLCKPKAVSQTQCLPWREATNEQSPRTPFGMNAPTLAIERPCFGFGHTPAAESHNMPAACWIPLLKSREEKKIYILKNIQPQRFCGLVSSKVWLQRGLALN